eukprot:3298149-Rhodomonas_salina.5
MGMQRSGTDGELSELAWLWDRDKCFTCPQQCWLSARSDVQVVCSGTGGCTGSRGLFVPRVLVPEGTLRTLVLHREESESAQQGVCGDSRVRLVTNSVPLWP